MPLVTFCFRMEKYNKKIFKHVETQIRVVSFVNERPKLEILVANFMIFRKFTFYYFANFLKKWIFFYNKTFQHNFFFTFSTETY